jgi:hypothetical protein
MEWIGLDWIYASPSPTTPSDLFFPFRPLMSTQHAWTEEEHARAVQAAEEKAEKANAKIAKLAERVNEVRGVSVCGRMGLLSWYLMAVRVGVISHK